MKKISDNAMAMFYESDAFPCEELSALVDGVSSPYEMKRIADDLDLNLYASFMAGDYVFFFYRKDFPFVEVSSFARSMARAVNQRYSFTV